MRYIDLDLMIGDLPAQPAIAAADAACKAILAETNTTKRKKLIDSHQPTWSALREHFQRVFGIKCWYVECENPGTDDDIDHFRPKGRLALVKSHGGYWWVALHWRNFRLSCHRSNRLRVNPGTGNTHGKGDHFPLLDEKKRCRLPSQNLSQERPTLLDPTDPADPPMLTFKIDGCVDVSPDYKGDPDAQRRIDDSRVYLHLEWPAFVKQRQTKYRDVCTKVSDGDRAADRLNKGEHAAREDLKAVARDLIRMTRDQAPYSRAATAYIKLFRTKGWVKSFVLPNIPQEG